MSGALTFTAAAVAAAAVAYADRSALVSHAGDARIVAPFRRTVRARIVQSRCDCWQGRLYDFHPIDVLLGAADARGEDLILGPLEPESGDGSDPVEERTDAFLTALATWRRRHAPSGPRWYMPVIDPAAAVAAGGPRPGGRSLRWRTLKQCLHAIDAIRNGDPEARFVAGAGLPAGDLDAFWLWDTLVARTGSCGPLAPTRYLDTVGVLLGPMTAALPLPLVLSEIARRYGRPILLETGFADGGSEEELARVVEACDVARRSGADIQAIGPAPAPGAANLPLSGRTALT